MKLAAQVGINITEFWEITPFELSIYADAYAKRQETEQKIMYENSVINAYLISRWVWQKRVDIKKFLNANGERKKAMTDEEMLAKVKALNAMFGGKVQKRRRKANGK